METPTRSKPPIAAFAALLAIFALAPGCRWAAVGQNIDGARLMSQGNYAGALQRFQQAVASDSKNADGYYNMGRVYQELGMQSGNQQQLASAEALYNQCLDVDPNHVDCHRALAVLLVETKRPDRAFNLLKNWAQQNPTNADARVELARLYHEFGDNETAQVQLDDAIGIDVTNPRVWSAMGGLREQQGDYLAALTDYQRSYGLNSFQPALHERIASIQRNTNLGLTLPTSNGTRTVNNGATTQRY